MTLAVDLGRKANKQTNKQTFSSSDAIVGKDEHVHPTLLALW